MESKQIKTCKVHENVNCKWFISKEIKYCYQTCSVLTSSTLLQLQSWKTSFKNWHKIYLPIWMSNRIELPMSLSSFISGFRQNPHHLQLKTNKPGRECPQHKCLWESGSFWIILQAKAALFVHFSTLNKKTQKIIPMFGEDVGITNLLNYKFWEFQPLQVPLKYPRSSILCLFRVFWWSQTCSTQTLLFNPIESNSLVVICWIQWWKSRLGMSRQGFCLHPQPGNCIIHLMEIYQCNLYNIHFKGVQVWRKITPETQGKSHIYCTQGCKCFL